MTQHIYEESKITPKVKLKSGVAESKKVEFIFLQDGEEVKKEEGELDDVTPTSGSGGWVKCEYELPKVDDDKEYYELTYYAKANNLALTMKSFMVWPRNAKLTALRDDDKKPFQGFEFEVLQGGKKVGDTYKTLGDNAEAEFQLDVGAAFKIEALAPYEITKWKTEEGRNRELEAKLNFEAEFINPDPTAGAIKQFVNLDTAQHGRDGFGNAVTIQVGVKGDRDLADEKKIGKPGLFVFVKIVFGPDGGTPDTTKSKRDDPKTELLDELNISDLTEVTEAKEYTAKVELAAGKGIGEFKVNLGYAGGDTCEINIGSTDECKDATLEFVNWRKLYYELMAPDFMDQADQELPAQMNDIGRTIYTEFVFHKAKTFTEDKAPDGTVLPRSFIGRNTGPAKVYVLSDHTFTKYPANFDKDKSPREVCIKFCDKNLFAENEASKALAIDVTTKAYDLKTTDVGGSWMPKSSLDGSDTIKSLTWKAKINPDDHKHEPTLKWEEKRQAGADGAKTRIITVKEKNQNKEIQIEFKKPMIGHISTDVSSTEKTNIGSFITGILDASTLRKNKNTVNLEITAETGTDRRDKRFDNAKKELEQAFNDKRQPIAFHPALDENGNPLEGNLSMTDVNMERSTTEKIAVDLPDGTEENPGPGRLAGPDPATDEKCPVKIKCKFQAHYEGLGLAGSGAQKGEILVVFDKDNMKPVVDTVLHEIAHLMNMTVYYDAGPGAHAPGLEIYKDTTENETNADYKHNGNKGHAYIEHGHSGEHCAYGLSDADKGLAEYDNAANPAECILIGGSDPSQAGPPGFCPQCKDYIKARDLQTIEN